jgi:16S rRNA (cytosine1402-N4)-methyltransferase
MASHDHIPVLLEEAVTWLAPRPGSDVIDCTVGRTGHARRILEATSPDGRLLGIDADETAIHSARVSLKPFAGRVSLVESYFDRLAEIASEAGFSSVDGVLFDLGVSSPQIDDPTRGFSFNTDGPLNMRMGNLPVSAAGLVATADQAELARIFREYGEERYANRIARRIVSERGQTPITTTKQLANLVSHTIPGTRGPIHPATRVFQALRIAVNSELERLDRALEQSIPLLKSGGRLVIISFHSLEDRIAKRFLRREQRGCICPSDVPACVCGRVPRVRILTSKPVVPTATEIESNPRSRSAKLRAAEVL